MDDIAALRELIFQRLELEKEERGRQAREYERRLQDLNHENARILTMQNKTVDSDVFRAFIDSNREKMDTAFRQAEQAKDLALARAHEKIDHAVSELRSKIETNKAAIDAVTTRKRGFSEGGAWIITVISSLVAIFMAYLAFVRS